MMILSQNQLLVAEFHWRMGASINRPVEDWREDRIKLLKEKVKELIKALRYGSMAEIAKENADVEYVLLGNAVAAGFNQLAVFLEVHKSNMSKLDDNGEPIISKNGKILKSKNYRPPNIKAVL